MAEPVGQAQAEGPEVGRPAAVGQVTLQLMPSWGPPGTRSLGCVVPRQSNAPGGCASC